jgi:hypothetical protein
VTYAPGGFGIFTHLFGAVFAGLFFVLLFLIGVGVLFVIVRFLLAATRAAETYVRVHRAAPESDTAAAPAPASAPVTPVAPTKPAATRPTTTRSTTTKPR